MKLNPAELMRTYLNQIVVDGRLDLITQLAQPDMIDEANQVFGGPPGREGLVAHVKGFRRNISELELTIDQIVAAETEVMAQWSFKGRHTGPWLGRTPTDLEVSGTVFSFFTLRNGLIERYRVWLQANLDEPIVFDSSA